MNNKSTALDNLYDFVTGDEDARVCKEIPEAACHHQPRNFFAYLVANLFSKISDEIASAKLVLPWLLGTLGAPVFLTAFLVPIREAGALLPQLAVAAVVRRLARRKSVWLLGALLSALTLASMMGVVLSLRGAVAGWAIVGLLVFFSLARGLCSISAKDVLGKTVSKSRRGVLMGWSASFSGLAVLGIGAMLGAMSTTNTDTAVFVLLLGGAGVLWLMAAGAFATIREDPGATEGGGNALSVALQSLSILYTDRPFQYFVTARLLLLAVALAPPFYVLLAQAHTGGETGGLGWLIVAAGLGASLSSPLWGRLSDRSSRSVMALAAGGSGALGIVVGLAVLLDLPGLDSAWPWAVTILLLTMLHSGVRLGRKVYLVDMATSETRATYVAVSNTVIGVAILAASSIGALGALFGPESLVLFLGVLSLGASVYTRRLPEVSG